MLHVKSVFSEVDIVNIIIDEINVLNKSIKIYEKDSRSHVPKYEEHDKNINKMFILGHYLEQSLTFIKNYQMALDI